MKGFFRELRDRSVVKVGIAYLVVTWLMLQLADVLFPALYLPDWSITLVLALLAIGFPVALVLAWAFDITPEGIKRAKTSTSPKLVTDQGEEAALPQEPESVGANRSIAVLPFADMSPDGDQEHFCDGLTEELLNVLTCIPGLRVASRTSSFAFKGKDSHISAVADRLGVAYVLEGSVRKDGDKVRIAAQLIEVASDSHLWSESFDHELCDIFAIQESIADRVLRALQMKLNTAGLPDCTTSDPRAYEYYLRGRGYSFTKTVRDIGQAVDMFRKATEADPGFIRAWVDLAEASTMHALFLGTGDTYVALAEKASAKANELAPARADTQMARAFALFAAKRFSEARGQFARVLEIDPSQVKAWHYMARASHHLGEKDKEIEYFTRATELDTEDWESPLLVIGSYNAIQDKENAKRMAAIGVERVQRHLDDYPENPRAYYLALGGMIALGRIDEAKKYAEIAMRIAPDDVTTRYNVACFYAVTDEPDKALDLLEDSVSSRSWIENDADWDNLRDHPRFRAVIDSLQK